jgi:hypothetical protein
MTLMPGIEAGAALYVNEARLVVQDAAAQGKHVEVWIIERRSSCLDDNTGFQAAAAAHDYHVAFSYYFNHQAIGGKTFAGFLTSADVPVLADLGLAQTLNDWADVITEGMPSSADRQHKMYCGGHSLGGPVTAALAGWDFDGTPGYTLCAGFWGEDTVLTTNILAKVIPGVTQGIDIIGSLSVDAVDTLLQANALSRITEFSPIFDPETLMVIQAVGIQAFYYPNAVSDYGTLAPASLRPALQFFLSPNAAAFATGNPPGTSYQLTDQAVLGTLLDNNTDPIGAFQAGLGTYDCSVMQKNFPLTDPTLMLPANPSTLCGWVPYNQMATAPVQLNDQGQPFTSASQEVSDISTLAEVLTDQPVDLTEPYFPTRLTTDVSFMALGNRGGDLASLKYPDGVAQRPNELILGGSGLVVGSGLSIPANAVIVPGYHHLDAGGLAAGIQNDGKPDELSATLAHFILTGKPA